MSRIVLRFNALVGHGPMAELEEISRRHSLKIESVREESPSAGKKFQVLDVSGTPGDLVRFQEELRRFPSVTSKMLSP